MPRQTMTVRVTVETREQLDAIAAALDRDRSYVVQQAIDSYVDLYRWQVSHIEKGLRQAEAGELIPHGVVKRRIRRSDAAITIRLLHEGGLQGVSLYAVVRWASFVHLALSLGSR